MALAGGAWAAPAVAAALIGFGGYGPYTWGMAETDVRQAAGLRGDCAGGGLCSDCLDLSAPEVRLAFYEKDLLAAISTSDASVFTNRGVHAGSTTTETRRAYPHATTQRIRSFGYLVRRQIVARFRGHALAFGFTRRHRIESITAYADSRRATRYADFC